MRHADWSADASWPLRIQDFPHQSIYRQRFPSLQRATLYPCYVKSSRVKRYEARLSYSWPSNDSWFSSIKIFRGEDSRFSKKMDNTFCAWIICTICFTSRRMICYIAILKFHCLNVMIYAKFYFIINYLYLCYYEPINFLCEKSVFSKLFNAYNCVWNNISINFL